MATKNYLLDLYEEAEKRNDWKILFPYWVLIVKWQNKHDKEKIEISRYASHWHGHIHIRCKQSEVHPVPHSRCDGRCEEFESFMRTTLNTRLWWALSQKQKSMDQQILLGGGEEDKK